MIDELYDNDSIIYWPHLKAGFIGRSFLWLIWGMVFLGDIWSLGEHVSIESIISKLLVLIPLSLVTCGLNGVIKRTSQIRIQISQKGILQENKYTNEVKEIRWENIGALYFVEDHWIGGKVCRIWLHDTVFDSTNKHGPCDFTLPVTTINIEKLMGFIPVRLR